MRYIFLICFFGSVPLQPPALVAQQHQPPIVIEDFESYPTGWINTRWQRTYKREIRPINPGYNNEKEYFTVVKDGEQQFLRVYVEDGAHKIVLAKGEGLAWNTKTHPRLRWDWRALKLPAHANEKHNKTNDTGAALYVTFGFTFWGKPKSIKYTYSSTLPVGTVTTYGSLKVIVVSSGRNGIGKWLTVERDVVADYRRFFKEDPPKEPLSIILWSDCDTVNDRAEADFDNITLVSK